MKNAFIQYRGYVLATILALIIGTALGVYIPFPSPIDPDGGATYERSSSYTFINPLLSCGDDKFSRIQNGQVLNLQNEITSYIKSEEGSNALDTASVYFRELNGGQFLTINASDQFVPASLLKVPLAMSIYQQAELNPKILSQKLYYPGSFAPASEYFTAPTLAASSTYTVSELVNAMITNSDNNAALLLTHVISAAALDQSYSDLGVIVPQDEQYTMTVVTYAGFFRVLYNATYLNHADSEELLNLLSQTKFQNGLVAGLPPDITVAHKFGERGFNDPVIPNQLHDCGIVYARNPYMVCIMTQGNDYNTLASAIAHISKMIYAYAGP
jgi:beta-lactamase class A